MNKPIPTRKNYDLIICIVVYALAVAAAVTVLYGRVA